MPIKQVLNEEIKTAAKSRYVGVNLQSPRVELQYNFIPGSISAYHNGKRVSKSMLREHSGKELELLYNPSPGDVSIFDYQTTDNVE